MVHIKKLVMQGFKSFAKRTEIPFDKGINVFVGPNGSGKTNVSDSILFALGRLSIKSMRAAKARNLIFMGSKYIKPAKEAIVEIIFDNSDRAFAIEKDEIHLKRVVRTNGQGIYKINGETKTRNEVIEMLAQAGIDPYGFNLIMQGQIQGVVKMHPEDRRGIIEEVAGISIYESRKEKSLHELEKTDERLKEIITILRERTAYLKNLEREKAQAQKYKDSELTVKRAKASILHRRLKEKEKEINVIVKSIDDKDKVKVKVREKIDGLQKELNQLNEKINDINKHIQKASGVEQEVVHNEIANLRAELEGLKVRRESYENRAEEVERRIEELLKTVPDIENEISGLRRESPLVAKKSEELKKKKHELEEIEQERKRLISIRTELQSLRERVKDKEKQLERVKAASESLLTRIEEISIGFVYENEEKCSRAIESLRKDIFSKKSELDNLIKRELEKEKTISIADAEILRAEKIKKEVDKLNICPLCQSKITEEHKKHVYEDSEDRIKNGRNEKEKSMHEVTLIKSEREKEKKELRELEDKLSKAEVELINHKNIREKKEQLKRAVNDEKILKEEIYELEDRRKKLETKLSDLDKIEEKYHRAMLGIEEVSSRTTENVDTTLLYKERELENMRNIIKRSKQDLVDIGEEINEIGEKIEDKSNLLEEKESKEKELQEKFKKMFSVRDEMQKSVQEKNLAFSETQNEIRQIEDQINYLKIGKAKLDAEHEAIEMELSEYVGIELIGGSIEVLEDKLKKAQEILQTIGSINMRALEVYDQVKKEYDSVYDRVVTLQKEKEDIMKIIEEIDRKKTRTFMKTFKAINNLFSENFSKLSSKGIAYLKLENEEETFSGGVTIVVKMAKGKYFDVSSLSGGEQTLVALSLLFAIQEYKPYHFYVFDEIDAALDKRNSERLAALLNQYMKSGQYIVISHNDAIITNSNVLYGVSMHEGVSKVLTLRVDESLRIGEENKTEEKSIGEKSIAGESEMKTGSVVRNDEINDV